MRTGERKAIMFTTRLWHSQQKKMTLSAHFCFNRSSFSRLIPVWRLSRAVGELPRHQTLIAAQCKLGPHQEASVEVGKAKNLEQRGHRLQG